ncbi:TonB-dependent receptor domain-containing protein [Pelagicoccus albus]|uniref:TonB-dependent receptor n=1 Tax=Pelagicoccus albus TaxID=415222 RepID=A0A7X1E9L9_9BACT|nr:TonB-dependent receptor [Pelagicoccus albus]MBC2607564.1 TonB-dependent receptor [Pelagicoccus albus]
MKTDTNELPPFGPTKFLALSALAGFASLSVAQEAPVDTVLEETTLTTAELPTSLGDVTTDAEIDSASLEQWSTEDLEGLFKTTLSAKAGGGRTQTQDIYIQGLQSSMTNVTIDGAQQVGLIFYHAGSGGSIETDLLKSISISAGTSNALSGPGALGGSLAYETKDGFDLLESGQSVGGSVKATYYADREDGYKLNAMGYGLLSDDWSYLVSTGYSDIGNYTDGAGQEVIQTHYRRKSALAKVSGNIDESQSLSVSYEYIKDQGAGSLRANVYPGEEDSVPNINERETLTFNYGFNPLGNDAVDTTFKFYTTERSLIGDTNNAMIKSVGLDLRNTSLLLDNGMTFTYGTDFREDTYGSNRVEGDEVGSVLGFYGQADWELSEAFLLSAGARYDSYDLESRDGTTFDQSGFSPNATLLYNATQDLTFHATYAEAFRGVYPVQSYLTNSETDPDIKPEESTNLEFGLEYTFGDYFVSGKLFETTIDNVINPRPRGTPRTNLGDYYADGYELMVGANIDKFRASAGVILSTPEVTNVDGTVTDETLSVNMKTGRTWLGNFEYRLAEMGITTGWTVEYVQAVSTTGARGTTKKSSTIVHDAFLRWEPVADSLDGVSINLAASNIFDNDYYEQTTFAYMNGYAAPGRDVTLTFGYKF